MFIACYYIVALRHDETVPADVDARSVDFLRVRNQLHGDVSRKSNIHAVRRAGCLLLCTGSLYSMELSHVMLFPLFCCCSHCSGPSVEQHDNGEQFPASQSKIHPSPTFRFAPVHIQAQNAHPSFLSNSHADHSSMSAITSNVVAFSENFATMESSSQQPPRSRSAADDSTLSEYDKQLLQFGRQQASLNGKINIDASHLWEI